MWRVRYIVQRCVKAAEWKLNTLGKQHECYICRKRFRHFNPWRGGRVTISEFLKDMSVVGSLGSNVYCPFCGSNDRERHLFMYFDVLGLWSTIRHGKVLHFAPEASLTQKILSLNPAEYVQADLFPSDQNVEKIDVTCTGFPDSYFDFVICNHVLEHVPDDQTAMSELFRVLKWGQYAVLQTPFSSLLAISLEDPGVNTAQLRLKYYGQEHHVRLYGRDFFERLKTAGFSLHLNYHKSYFSPQTAKYYGVNPKEDLILVLKCHQ